MLQSTGLTASWHVGSSQTRDQTHVPCTGRQILNHWATKEVPDSAFLTSSQVVSVLLAWEPHLE